LSLTANRHVSRLPRLSQERFNRLQVQCSAALRDKSEMQTHIEQMERATAGGEEDALRAEVSIRSAAPRLRLWRLRPSAPLHVDITSRPLFAEQIDALREELRAAHELQGQPQSGGGSDALMHELRRAQDANAELLAECDALRAEATARVERSTQFLNVKSMLAKKNDLVRRLRDQLREHGLSPHDDVEAYD
jgi:hypothetical protein